jgi:hypothetical protein
VIRLLPKMRLVMKLFLLTLIVFGLMLFGMSVGVIFNRRIRGTCGGLSHGEGIRGSMARDACSTSGRHCADVDSKQFTPHF